jgi:DNA or RNA helicases of superfamily II
MIKNAIEKGNKVLFLVHLKELLDQTEEKLKQVGVTEGYKLAMIQTYSKRLDYDPGFIVIDECHHTRSATYQTILDKHANVPLVGLSATPLRLDGKGLGSVFDVLIQGPKMQELIEQGYLADYDVVSVNSNVDLSSVSIKFGDYNKQELESALNRSCIYGDAISNYKKFLNGKKAIAFCTSIEASKKLAIDFQNNGVPAAHLDGTLDKKQGQKL